LATDRAAAGVRDRAGGPARIGEHRAGGEQSLFAQVGARRHPEAREQDAHVPHRHVVAAGQLGLRQPWVAEAVVDVGTHQAEQCRAGPW
jgi:hypothetical protein